VGTTIMMDGSALYEGSAVIFLAQMENDSLSFNKCVSLGTGSNHLEHFT
jgi:Na+/H+-dicarboxylate symporter